MRRGYEVDGLRIAQLRQAKLKQNQAEFSRTCGIHWVTMSNIENGKARVSLETLERIATELAVGRDELLPSAADQALSADDDEESDAMADLMSAIRRLVHDEVLAVRA